MVKRKRSEESLEEKLEKWQRELVRGFKTAKGFERQRYSKRFREADPDKAQRLEREIAVLKNIDLHKVAHQHLCSSLLKIKGMADAPKLPKTVHVLPKPNLSEEEHAALHNVTSALCNRKQVRDIIDEAIMGSCIALRVPMPEKKGKGKGQKIDRREQEDQADDIEDQPAKSKARKEIAKEAPTKAAQKETGSDVEDSEESWEGFGSEAGDLGGSDAEEKAFSKFDDMLAGSSEDDSEGPGSEDEDAENSRARSIRGPSDYFSGSSAEEEDSAGDEDEDEDDEEDKIDEEEDAEEGDTDEESDDEDLLPPPKKAKTKSAKPVAVSSGGSAFLPSLMGGYISGSESEASDIDVAPPVKKNRRGQKARQAIWEKKFKEKAKHLQNQAQKGGKDQGWDMRRGAVGDEDSGPWKKGVRSGFEKTARPTEGVHPSRQSNFGREGGPSRSSTGGATGGSQVPREGPSQAQTRPPPPPPPPKPKPKKDDEGPLHPSWQAAKLAKEASQKVAFQGKKVTFD